MDDHKHGDMDTKDHEKTFAGFVAVTQWVVIAILAILVFMAIFVS